MYKTHLKWDSFLVLIIIWYDLIGRIKG